jgi:hypothetical protein
MNNLNATHAHSEIASTVDHDWTKVEPGTCIVVESLSDRFPPREDGLCELEFLRIKRTDGYPVFCLSGDAKRKPCRWVPYEFAFSDDIEGVRRLARKAAADAAESAARALERERETAERKKQQSERRSVELAILRSEHEAKAAGLGLTLDQFEDCLRLWNQIRSNRFRPNSCFVCGRALVDPVSIETGIGPECSRRMGDVAKVARATQAEWIGKMRFDANRLVAKLQRAGLEGMISQLESMLKINSEEVIK